MLLGIDAGQNTWVGIICNELLMLTECPLQLGVGNVQDGLGKSIV